MMLDLRENFLFRGDKMHLRVRKSFQAPTSC